MNTFSHQLLADIQKQKELYTDTYEFIKSRDLVPVRVPKAGLSLENLPVEITMGNVYLIKSSTILQSYSWCDYNHSPFRGMSVKQPLWVNKIEILHMPESESMYTSLHSALEENDTYNYYPGTVKKYIMSLVNKGFKLYIPNS